MIKPRGNNNLLGFSFFLDKNAIFIYYSHGLRCSLPNHLDIKNKGVFFVKKKSSFRLNDLSKIAIVAALYVALTLVLAPLSYANIQIRIAECLIMLCFYSKKYEYSLTIGCFITNIFSPLGWYDMVFGTLATLIAVIGVNRIKNIYLAALWAILWNGIIIGIESSIVYQLPFLICAGEVAIGELIAIMIIGIPFIHILKKSSLFDKLVNE